jgi:hypothetical protein
MAVYKSKKITGTDLNTLLTNLKKSRYFNYGSTIPPFNMYKSKKPYLKIKKVATS